MRKTNCSAIRFLTHWHIISQLPHFFASQSPAYFSRRDFLRRAGPGLGMLALTPFLDEQGLLAAAANTSTQSAITNLNPLAPHPSHFPAQAKSVIWLFMNGGQSQVDTWDYKPELEKRDGQELPGFDKNTGFFTNDVGP